MRAIIDDVKACEKTIPGKSREEKRARPTRVFLPCFTLCVTLSLQDFPPNFHSTPSPQKAEKSLETTSDDDLRLNRYLTHLTRGEARGGERCMKRVCRNSPSLTVACNEYFGEKLDLVAEKDKRPFKFRGTLSPHAFDSEYAYILTTSERFRPKKVLKGVCGDLALPSGVQNICLLSFCTRQYDRDHVDDVVVSMGIILSFALAGDKFEYTTHGFTLLSAAMEAAAGEPFDKLMRRTFRDLGLKHTDLDEHESIVPHRAK